MKTNIKKLIQCFENIDSLEEIADEYGNYLNLLQSYHDKVIKRMYRNTVYKDCSPEELRQILRQQFSSQKKVSEK